MTRVARRCRDDVLRRFAGSHCTVVATRTRARSDALVAEERWRPGDGPVANPAGRRCRYVLHRHIRAREHAARHVAHGTFPGCAVEKSIYVARLASHRTVRSAEREACHRMIEIDPACSFRGRVNREHDRHTDESERHDNVLKSRAQQPPDRMTCLPPRPRLVIDAIFPQQCAVLSRCCPTYTAMDMPPFGVSQTKRIQDKHLLATVPSLPIQRLFPRTLQTSLSADTVMCAFSTRTNCNAAAQLPEVGSEMATRALLPKPPVMHVVAVVAVNATPTCGVYGLAGP